MNLDEKLKNSLCILQKTMELFPSKQIRLAWTGGKDSTLIFFLWQQVIADKFPVRAVNIDTGYKFPEVLSFRDKLAKQHKVELTILSPEADKNYLVAQNPIDCCQKLKIKPLHKYLNDFSIEALITGIRRDEHPSRSQRIYFEKRSKPEYMEINPILDWTEQDVWAWYMQEQAPYCNLYDLGYRSLGCVPCTKIVFHEDERAGRNQEKEEALEQLRSLGYF